jgi:hypothetical protein
MVNLENLPFSEQGQIRTFSKDLSDWDLKWHWDEQDRTVEVLDQTDWQFQFDNRRPQALGVGDHLFVPAGTWHRLIKGSEDLKLRIIKHVTRFD